MIKDYFSMSLKNLSRRGIRSYLTLLGIFIGIVAVVSLISLGSGLRAGVNSQFGAISPQIISIQAGGLNSYGPPGSNVASPLKEEYVEAIEKLPTIDTAIGRSIISAKVEFNDKLGFVMAVSMPKKEKIDFVYDEMGLDIESGRLLEGDENKKIIVGNNFNKEDNKFGEKIESGDVVLINGEKFRVIGVLEKKGSFIMDNVIYVNEKPLDNIANFGEDRDVIAAKAKSKELMDKAKRDIEELLRKKRDVDEGEEDFEVSTPESALKTVNTILGAIQGFIVLIALVSISVGAIGIINTMTTSVLERTKEIGIMKAVGAKNKDIFLQFLIEAGLLGLIGGMVGVFVGETIGFFGTLAINKFIGTSIAPRINIILIISTLVGSFMLGSISGIIPAMKAAKQNPVEALRD